MHVNTIKFKSKITKGNNKRTGFIRIPIRIRNNFSIRDQYKVIINSKIEYYGKIRNYNGKGIFVPAKINIKNNLYKKLVEVELLKIDGFYTKIGNDGRVYIPNSYEFKKGDIISINVKINEKEFTKYSKINLREKNSTKEFIFFLDNSFYNKKAIIKINNIFKKNKPNQKFLFENNPLLKSLDFTEIEKNKILIYYGNRAPIIVNKKIDIKNLAYYLGCYFADGTKRGTHWGISASTFEQANYFIKKHSEIILDPKIVLSLTYTYYNENNIENLKLRLTNIWSRKTNSKIMNNRIRIIKTKTKYASNRNLYGSLSIKENRQLILIYYNRLLKYLFKIINKELATDFICGVMEGDGCVNSKTRAHVVITTNSEEIKILKDICDKSHLKSSIRFWNGKKNRFDLLIGSLEIIKNIPTLKDKLFKYHPKRRKILKQRLAQTGCAKFLLLKSKKTSNWLIGQLKKENILDKNGNLTKYGKFIKKNLKEFLNK